MRQSGAGAGRQRRFDQTPRMMPAATATLSDSARGLMGTPTRRSMAVALEQENSAKVQEKRADLVEAEAKVPLAIAEAFRSGNLGVMDYMRYRNIQSDTAMREAIAEDEEGTSEPLG